MNSTRSVPTLFATIVGLALAALCKLTYDLFNGYALVPNLFLSIGWNPPQVVLDALLLFCLLGVAFGVGTLLVENATTSPHRSAALAALPWVAFSLVGVISGLLSAQWSVLRELFATSPSAILLQLLLVLSVPVGLWLALRRRPNIGEA